MAADDSAIDQRGPRRGKKASKPREVTAEELRVEIRNVLDVSTERAIRRRAFRQLVVAARKAWPVVVNAISASRVEAGSLEPGVAWLSCELALDAYVLEGGAPRNLESLGVDPVPVAVATRLARSIWISDNDFPGDWRLVVSKRRGRIPAPSDDHLLDTHPLLATDDSGAWPAAMDQWTRDPLEALPLADDVVLDFATVDAPLARELRARRELATMRQRGGELTSAEIRALASGRRVLEAIIDDAGRSLASTDSASTEYDARIRIALFVGRQPDIWGTFDKVRCSLIRLGPSSPGEAGKWAELVALTHSRTAKAMEAVADVPDTALATLLAAASRHNLQRLVERGQDVVMQRINRDCATRELWSGILALADDAPRLRRWITSYVAPYAPPDLPTDATTSGGDAVLVAQARRAPIDEILTGRFLERARTVAPELRAVILACMIKRLTLELPSRRSAYIEAMARRLRELASALGSREIQVERLLGSVPPKLGQPLASARETVLLAASKIQSEEPQVDVARERVPIVPALEPEVGDVVRALHTLAFDPLRDSLRDESSRAAVQRRLAWQVVHEPEVLASLGDVVTTLPPEGLGALWETGVQRRAAPLLAGLSATLSSLPWAKSVWVDVLVAAADHGDGPLPIDAETANVTCDLLEQRIANLQARLAAPDPTGAVEQTLSAAGTAVATAFRAVSDVVAELGAIVNSALQP